MSGNIEFCYQLERGDFNLDVAANLEMRGITGMFGPSGAGKTSLLRCIAGLESANRAKLIIDGEIWDDTDAGVNLATHERHVAYVFQEPRLFPHLDVRGNLEYARKRAGVGKRAPEIDTVIKLLDLNALLARHISALSGGEAQRVAIGRALLRAPRVLLMDEPVAALDVARRDEILPLLERLHTALDVPVIYVSHNIDEICLICDQLLVLEAGRVSVAGGLQEVLTQTDVPGLGGEEAGAVISAKTMAYDETFDLTRMQVTGGELMVPGRVDESSTVRLRIRASDVSLCRERAKASSILNVLPAVITAIEPESGHSVLVRLKTGEERLLARITRRSAADLNLLTGDSVFVQIKSIAVRRASL